MLKNLDQLYEPSQAMFPNLIYLRPTYVKIHHALTSLASFTLTAYHNPHPFPGLGTGDVSKLTMVELRI